MRKDEFPIVEEYCRDKIIKELEKVKAEIEENGVWVRYNIEGRTDRDIENIVEAVLKQAKESFIYRLDKHISELKGE